MITAAAAQVEDPYHRFLTSFRNQFTRLTADAKALFTTNATGLWDTFLSSLPPWERQHHTCHACRRFVEQYGGLVTIDDMGLTDAVMWGRDVPLFYQPAFSALRRLVERAKVTGVFFSDHKMWGTPVTDMTTRHPTFHHMAVQAPPHLIRKPSTLVTAEQDMAVKREEYGMLQRGLQEFPFTVVEQALEILKSDTLYRSEKVLGPAQWLHDLHKARAATAYQKRDNVTWRAVASAPPGFSHVKSTMIGSLLEDLASGASFEGVRKRFAQKMNPLQYQRPTAPPTLGNIAQAEKIVAELGLSGALDRRFASLVDVETLWRPTVPEVRHDGVFGHLKAPTTAPTISGTSGVMTWVKFQRDVLPNARKIEYLVPHGAQSYIALITAQNRAAPPILQWDHIGRRNPVNWYVYPHGSNPTQWNLYPGRYVEVTGICDLPCHWGGSRSTHQGEGAILLLKDCRDTQHTTGNALFPEVLRGDLREVRNTISAYSARATIAGRDTATACGLDLRKGRPWKGIQVRVTQAATTMMYTLDRWE